MCGEALDQLGHVFQESCFETKILKEDTEGNDNMLENKLNNTIH